MNRKYIRDLLWIMTLDLVIVEWWRKIWFVCYLWFITFFILMPYPFYTQDLCISSHIVILYEIILHCGKSLSYIIDICITENKIFSMPWTWAQTAQIFWSILCSACCCLTSNMLELMERLCKYCTALTDGDRFNFSKS